MPSNSSYYYSTPIGQGMSNLATAIGSMPDREAKLGLMAARQKLLDEQTQNEVVQRDVYRGQARNFNAQASEREQGVSGREDLAAIILGRIAAAQGVAPTEAMPAPIDGGGVAGAITGPMPAFRSGLFPETQAGAAPADLATAVAPSGPGRTVRPMTAEDQVRYTAAALRAKMAPEKAQLMNEAGLVATQQPNPDAALTYNQIGAGKNFGGTIGGTREETARKSAADVQRSADTRYGADTRAKATVDAAHVRANAPGKGGKGRKLTLVQEQKVRRELIEDLELEHGMTGVKPEDVTPWAKKVSARIADGESIDEAMDAVKSEMVETTPGVKSPWYDLLTKDKPESKKLKKLSGVSMDDAPATAAPKGWPKDAPVFKKGEKVAAGQYRKLGNGTVVQYQNGKWIGPD